MHSSRLWFPQPKRIWVPNTPQIIIVETPAVLVSVGGRVSVRERPYRKIIGHPDLGHGVSFRVDDKLYVSIPEAITREKDGQTVEFHWEPDQDDERDLAPFKERVRMTRAHDPESAFDGWFRR